MTLYEHVFIARQDVSSQRAQALIEEFSAIITKQGGRIGKTEYWGLQNLAYKIKKNQKGHYMLMDIETSHEVIGEMERQMKLHDDILRFQTVRVDAHDPNPSAPMQRAQAKEKAWSENDNDQNNDQNEAPKSLEAASPEEKTEDKTEDKTEEKIESESQ